MLAGIQCLFLLLPTPYSMQRVVLQCVMVHKWRFHDLLEDAYTHYVGQLVFGSEN